VRALLRPSQCAVLTGSNFLHQRACFSHTLRAPGPAGQGTVVRCADGNCRATFDTVTARRCALRVIERWQLQLASPGEQTLAAVWRTLATRASSG
jgi:hypothetical protein